MSARKPPRPSGQEVNEYVRLPKWLRHDEWTVHEGLLLLLGLDPDGTEVIRLDENRTVIRRAKTLAGQVLIHLKTVTAEKDLAAVTAKYFELTGRSIVTQESEQAPHKLEEIGERYREILSIWLSGRLTDDRYEPATFVDWASDKKIDVPWLGWARQQGLLPLREAKSSPRTETANLHIIGALLAAMLKLPGVESEAHLIEGLVEKHDGVYGISKSSLEKKFADAKRSLNAAK